MRIMSKGAIASSRPSGAFSPSDVSGLVAWWDFATTDYLTVNGSNQIAQATDRSGTGNHMKQATDANKPVWTASQLNSLGGAVYTQASSHLLSLDSTYDVTQALTIFELVKCNDTTTDKYCLKNATNEYTWYSQYSARIALKAGNVVILGNNSYDTSALFTYYYVDGASSEGHNRLVDATALDAGANAFTLDELGTSMDGVIFEVLVYNSKITGTDLTNIQTYFTDRWGSGI